ncbi:MAG: hypothetical protein ABI834_04555 [Ginsengibacter sp.]
MIDGETGFVIKQNDIPAFVNTVMALANDVQLRKKMGARGKRFVKENYDSKILNERLVSIYYGMLSETGK